MKFRKIILVFIGCCMISMFISCNDDVVEQEEEIPIELDLLDGIKESMFKIADDEFLFLTLNLHTYQESDQEHKFDIITEVIGRMDIDFVSFQECAQNKFAEIDDGEIRIDNMALILSDKIREEYNVDYEFAWDWAHYGWDVWEEGVAVFSKHSLTESESRFISSNTSNTNIQSRKVIYGAYDLPSLGRINLFSAHTHWRTSETSTEQNLQMENIKAMAAEKDSAAASDYVFTFICGDFNSNPVDDDPWNEGYLTMMEGDEYLDTFLEIFPDANDQPNSSYNTIGGTFPGRIDFVFMGVNENFTIVDSQIIFSSDVAGMVSDHLGVLTKVKFVTD